MPELGNFSAWVEVSGERLAEYKIEYSNNGARATCWIPSEAGKIFQVCYQDISRTVSTATKLTVDGNRCQGKILHDRNSTRRRRSKDVTSHRGMILSENTIRPYMFSNCRLVEDEMDTLLTDISAIGEIKLDVDEVLLGQYKPRQPQRELPPLQIYERAKKGIVHGTQLGEAEVTLRERPSRSVTTLRRLATFEFKYRPIDILIANGIAPRPSTKPRPLIASSSSEVIDLTLEDRDGDEGARRSNTVGRGTPQRAKREFKHERSLTFDDTVIDLTI